MVFLWFSYKPRPVSCDPATVAQLVHAPLGEEGDVGELRAAGFMGFDGISYVFMGFEMVFSNDLR